MTNLKRHGRSIFLLICLISLFTLMSGCNNHKQNQNENKQHNKFGSIDKNDIVSFKMHNIKAEFKEIKSKSDRNKIINLINSVHITNTGIQSVDGVGYGVIITYSNGQKFSASFTGPTMTYSTKDNVTWCEVDKNIVEDLRNYYDKN